MSVHTKRVLSILTPQFLAAEIKEIVKTVEKFPDPKKIAVGDLSVGQFREIQLTFYGSKRMLKEFTEMYVGRFIRGYVNRFSVPMTTAMELLASTEPNEWAAVDLLYDHYKKTLGQVSPEEVAKIELIVDGIHARNKVRIEEMQRS